MNSTTTSHNHRPRRRPTTPQHAATTSSVPAHLGGNSRTASSSSSCNSKPFFDDECYNNVQEDEDEQSTGTSTTPQDGGEIFGQNGWSSLDQSIILQYHFDFNEVTILQDDEDNKEKEDEVDKDYDDNDDDAAAAAVPPRELSRQRDYYDFAKQGEEKHYYYRQYTSNINKLPLPSSNNNGESCASRCYNKKNVYNKYSTKNNNNNSMTSCQFENSQRSCPLTERSSTSLLWGSSDDFSLSFNNNNNSSSSFVVVREKDEFVGDKDEEEEVHVDDDDDDDTSDDNYDIPLPPSISLLDRYNRDVAEYEEQRKIRSLSPLQQQHEVIKQEDEQQGLSENYNCYYESDTIQVVPGISLPLKGYQETLAAIYDGRATIGRCGYCNINLHCIDIADLIFCQDCFVLSPVDSSCGSSSNNNNTFAQDDTDEVALVVNEEQLSRGNYTCVGLGFKTKDILAKLEHKQEQEYY